MPRIQSTGERGVLTELSRTGLLLQSDPFLPNVAAIVSGDRIVGSWWGHKQGHEIFGVLKRLNSNPDALVTRLVSGKVTYLHRRLWQDFLSVATSEDRWQTVGLSRAARQLFRLVQKQGELRLDQIEPRGSFSRLSRGAREIEERLLVYGDEVHTETGAHAKVLMTWSRCPKLSGFHPSHVRPAEAMSRFEAVVEGLNNQYGAHASLPWPPPAKH